MSSPTRRRPPAIQIAEPIPVQHAQRTLVRANKNTQGEKLGIAWPGSHQGIFVQNPLAINPVLEPPATFDWQSIRQPITVEGYRRWVRSWMRTSKPFTGLVPQIPAKYLASNTPYRDKMAGSMTRPFTYAYTPAAQGPGNRVIGLGGGNRPATGQRGQVGPGRGGYGSQQDTGWKWWKGVRT